VRVILLQGVLGVEAACSSDPVDPGGALPKTMTSSNFVYHRSSGDQAPDTAYQERHLAWVEASNGFAEPEA
jgi:hypothetical protein